ncbi:aminoacetone oxidase family FAD-binding enzyme [Anaerococcus degeneri]|uniref:Aminoacetone oxidase family FAD-binding enzyme n=1 Tax=Anaerococcus degeneri TaxID=361500 RepID=A0ABS7Z060_9FIRM|nr:aminoacetone oxidase family FAD-binding enzyme [Anaerococcus degeneri]MBP2016278.1 putative Rossmann fold flavoprotein [Anaerococcus degeneri]MCA2096719.1 aminoacetone oxidase family FAD-binding enzyme [Anaerococcus degeneri]
MKTVLIGGGVAGLFFANLYDGNLIVVEKNDVAGRKLLATGNGRCNFTNLNLSLDNFHSSGGDFYKYALGKYDNYDLINFLNDLGILTTSLPSGRCYPQTLSAKTIRDILYLNARGKFLFESQVKDIDFENHLVIIDDAKIYFDKLIIATGGISLPGSGSDGKIFEILRPFHKVTRLTYGITNYKTANPLSKKAKGVRVSAKASLFVGGKFIKESTDDVIFQTYGLTGTAIFDLSNEISYALSDGKDIWVCLDLLVDYSEEKLLEIIKKLGEKNQNKTIEESLMGFLNAKLIIDVLNRVKLKSKMKVSGMNDGEIKNLIGTIKDLRFKITGINDEENAQVTIGGIDTEFVDPNTFESKIIPNLYFIGEVLDVDGACGGYNIQWAYSSAKACARGLLRNDREEINVKDK